MIRRDSEIAAPVKGDGDAGGKVIRLWDQAAQCGHFELPDKSRIDLAFERDFPVTQKSLSKGAILQEVHVLLRRQQVPLDLF